MMHHSTPFLLICLLCLAGCSADEVSTQSSLLSTDNGEKNSLTSQQTVSNQTVAKGEVPLPEPTSRETLLKLQKLGAEWKRNKHGQVNWLNLKLLPITDDDLVILQELPEVQLLHLRGIHKNKGHDFTNAGLLHLLCLKKLRHLDLSVNYGLTDECSTTLKQMTLLESLNLSGTRITVASLPDIIQLKNLGVFHVPKFPLDKNTIGYFEQMPLRELWGISNPKKSFHFLPRLSHLEKLPSTGSDYIKDTDLVHLQHISKIKSLQVILTKSLSDTSQLKYLQNLLELENLEIIRRNLVEPPYDLSGLHCLAKIPNLKKISTGWMNDRYLEAISHCTQVTHLDFEATGKRVTQAGLLHLKNMHSLKSIDLDRSWASDKMLEILGQMPSLERINFQRWNPWHPKKQRQIKKRMYAVSSLKHLKRLTNLKELYLPGYDIDDEALAYIGSLKTLEVLGIGGGPHITNAGLLQLKDLPNLKKLDFRSSNIDREAALKLHQFIPQCYIYDNWTDNGEDMLEISPKFVVN